MATRNFIYICTFFNCLHTGDSTTPLLFAHRVSPLRFVGINKHDIKGVTGVGTAVTAVDVRGATGGATAVTGAAKGVNRRGTADAVTIVAAITPGTAPHPTLSRQLPGGLMNYFSGAGNGGEP